MSRRRKTIEFGIDLDLELEEEYENKPYNLYRIVKIIRDEKGNEIERVKLYVETFTDEQINRFDNRDPFSTIDHTYVY